MGRWARRSLEGEGGIMRLIATTFFILDVLDSVRRLRKDAASYQNIIFVRYLMATAYLPERLAPLGYDFFAKLLPMPERLLLVDIDPQLAHRRIVQRRLAKEMFEDAASLESTRRKLLLLARRGKWRIVDNNGAPEAAKGSLLRILEEWG
jgi:dTMP kinase